MIVYKIRHKLLLDTYLTGTPMHNKYDRNGRIFPKLGALRSFITSVLKIPHRAKDIEDWEIVEFELTVQNVRPVQEIVKPEKIIQLLKQ